MLGFRGQGQQFFEELDRNFVSVLVLWNAERLRIKLQEVVDVLLHQVDLNVCPCPLHVVSQVKGVVAERIHLASQHANGWKLLPDTGWRVNRRQQAVVGGVTAFPSESAANVQHEREA